MFTYVLRRLLLILLQLLGLWGLPHLLFVSQLGLGFQLRQ